MALAVALVFGILWVKDPAGPRQAVMAKLTTLARLRGVDIDDSKPAIACTRLSVPKPFDDAIIKVLEFTGSLTTKDATDIRFSHWVDKMANAAIGYLDHVIANVRPASSSQPAAPDQTGTRPALRVRFRDGVVCDVRISASVQVGPQMAPKVVARFGSYAKGEAHAANTVEACALAELERFSSDDARQLELRLRTGY